MKSLVSAPNKNGIPRGHLGLAIRSNDWDGQTPSQLQKLNMSLDLRWKPRFLDEILHRSARTPVERSVVKTEWKMFARYFVNLSYTQAQNEFIFRCYVVPQYCAIAVAAICKPEPQLGLFEHSAYIIACERTHWEMMITRATFEPLSGGHAIWHAPKKKEDFLRTPLPSLGDFTISDEDSRYWTARFDIWRKAALRSFFEFHKQFCADLSDQDRPLRNAALTGYIHWKTPLPHDLFDILVKSVLQDGPQALNVLAKNWLKPTPTRRGLDHQFLHAKEIHNVPSSLAIDSWLIEIWPLVVTEKWGYPDILRIAEIKTDNWWNDALDCEGLQDRCRRLELLLPKPLTRGGRPRKGSRLKDKPVSFKALFAAFLKGIGENPQRWMLGQHGLTGT